MSKRNTHSVQIAFVLSISGLPPAKEKQTIPTCRGRSKEKDMQRHSYVRVRKLHDVSGFVDYVSNESRQEHLLSSVEIIDPLFAKVRDPKSYWSELAKYNHFAHEISMLKGQGQAIEAREIVIAFPEEFYYLDHDTLNKTFAQWFYEKYGVSVSSAIHLSEMDEDGTFRNMHMHLVFSERQHNGIIPLAERNWWRDLDGKRISKKQAGELGEGNYIFIAKGEPDPWSTGEWAEKNPAFKEFEFVPNIKTDITEMINGIIRNENLNVDPLEVFDPKGVYLPTVKIGKNKNQTFIDNIIAGNELARMHNEYVDQTLFETQGFQERQNKFIEKARNLVSAFKKFKLVTIKEKAGLFLERPTDYWLGFYKSPSIALAGWVEKNIPSLSEKAKAFKANISEFDGQLFIKRAVNAPQRPVAHDMVR